MNSSWSRAKLGEVLRRSEETVTILPDAEYREVTVRLWGKGVVLRGAVAGASIAASRRFVAKAGQLILSRIDVGNGAIGIVPSELDGAVVTNDFPLFDVNPENVTPAFLHWLTKTQKFVELCQRASEGTTNRVRLQEDRFLALEIPLPPLAEQRRSVARIEELAAKIEDARNLREGMLARTEALIASYLNAYFASEAMQIAPRISLGAVAEIVSGVTLGRRLTGRTIRLPYLRVANVQDGHLDLSEIKEVGVLETEVNKWQLACGDLLLTEGGDWDKLGRGTVWRGEIANCIHQNHIFRLRTRPEDFVPEFLAALIGSPVGKAYFQAASKQTTNLASINQRQLRAFPVFQPPLSGQHKIVTELNALQDKVDALIRVQAEIVAELDALLPSILDRAFKGEL